MPERPDDTPDLHPGRIAADPLLRELAEMVAYVDLHISKYVIKQLTTRQKEMWADLTDAVSVLREAEDPGNGEAARTTRWWRDTWDGPTGPEDPRWHDHTHREPDPFEGRGAVTITRDDLSPAALRLAQLVTMGHTGPYVAEDLVAVYEWAKANARPFQRADSTTSSMLTFPSLAQARAFLASYDAARTARINTTP